MPSIPSPIGRRFVGLDILLGGNLGKRARDEWRWPLGPIRYASAALTDASHRKDCGAAKSVCRDPASLSPLPGSAMRPTPVNRNPIGERVSPFDGDS